MTGNQPSACLQEEKGMKEADEKQRERVNQLGGAVESLLRKFK